MHNCYCYARSIVLPLLSGFGIADNCEVVVEVYVNNACTNAECCGSAFGRPRTAISDNLTHSHTYHPITCQQSLCGARIIICVHRAGFINKHVCVGGRPAPKQILDDG